MKHFDRDTFLEQLDNEEDTLLMFLEEAKKQLTEDLSKLEQEIGNENSEQVKSLSHKIKGTARNMYFQYMADIALQLEMSYTFKKEKHQKMFNNLISVSLRKNRSFI